MNLYKFYWDCGRQGYLESLFIADDQEVKESIGHEVYFGEALGKHSEIYGELKEGDIELMSDDQELVNRLLQIFGYPDRNPDSTIPVTLSGYDPLVYLEPSGEQTGAYDESQRE